jgi:hypothetical protein
VIAKFNSHVEDEKFRNYMASSLYWNGQGKTLTITYDEYRHPKPIGNRTGDEIALDVIKGLGLKWR